MSRYVVRRLVQAVPVALTVTVILFVLMRLLPGDPAMLMLGEEASPEAVSKLKKEMGLDKPIYVQYGLWLGRVLRGDLGRSIRTNQPVSEALRQRAPVTLELGVLAILISLAIALPMGIVSAMYRNSLWDRGGTVLALAGLCTPAFLVGILLIYLFGVTLHWIEPFGFVPFFNDPLANLKRMILPALTLGTAEAALVMRLTRSGLLDVLGQDYIVTARSKGLPERTVTVRHALRNALIPVVTVVGLRVGGLLAGAVIAETVFTLPGMGKLIVDAIFARNFPVVQGAVLLLTGAFIFVNLIVDLLYAYIDPRIRYE